MCVCAGMVVVRETRGCGSGEAKMLRNGNSLGSISLLGCFRLFLLSSNQVKPGATTARLPPQHTAHNALVNVPGPGHAHGVHRARARGGTTTRFLGTAGMAVASFLVGSASLGLDQQGPPWPPPGMAAPLSPTSACRSMLVGQGEGQWPGCCNALSQRRWRRLL